MSAMSGAMGDTAQPLTASIPNREHREVHVGETVKNMLYATQQSRIVGLVSIAVIIVLSITILPYLAFKASRREGGWVRFGIGCIMVLVLCVKAVIITVDQGCDNVREAPPSGWGHLEYATCNALSWINAVFAVVFLVTAMLSIALPIISPRRPVYHRIVRVPVHYTGN